ncbi:oxaloacetate decarboxylase subunit alpha [Alkaliphilus sp. MSJ-5]|uniref:Oxaloacetate decarboxylase subunit alpha n=1 Tax=Alkaliphilus flagellatus TaxID=2841507 RepID=A0ABS6G7Z2_9FIRM|nr:oxaloacetate decarboxylase subunit alpha [Alkaliphilus flagellatus]MBU5677521.1 oxaloacetate decarboxylase subunit alpha [Alkaliphilus flagellatus]
MTKLKITETVLRDAHQSLFATRMKTEEMLPIAKKLDQVGYHSLEMWGGATFDASLRFLNEDPWERLRSIRKVVKNTKLQMLLRGQNLLGYKHYADDVVSEFVKKSIYNGIDIIRIFDALNDIRNLETAVKATLEEGGHAQCALSYTISPAHNIEYYVNKAKDMESLGASSICIKDMSGILTPYAAFELVTELKKTVNIPLQIHTHYTSGIASMTYLKAIEAGIDVVDTAISPLALGTSQPPTEPLVAAFKDTKYDTGLDLELLNEVAEYFRPIKEQYLKSGLIDPKVLGVDAKTLVYQVPGGMLSNLISQLKSQNKLDKFEEVLQEVPRVREELGYPPLVTPMSQMVGTQAVFNVITGERYKMVPKEIKDYVKGLYGQTTVPIKDDIKEKIIGNEEVITCRPADLIQPQLEILKEEMKEYSEQEEDVLSYALFPQIAESFFKERWAKKYKIETTLYDEEAKTHPV